MTIVPPALAGFIKRSFFLTLPREQEAPDKILQAFSLAFLKFQKLQSDAIELNISHPRRIYLDVETASWMPMTDERSPPAPSVRQFEPYSRHRNVADSAFTGNFIVRESNREVYGDLWYRRCSSSILTYLTPR